MTASCQIEAQGDGRVRVTGELTFATAREARAAGQRVLKSQPPQQAIHIDCGGIVRGDSAGLAVLLDWLGWARAAGQRLTYANLPPQIISIAEISELDELLVGQR